jgi:septal ring factor EnvC (AmiA/AmiB activator)
MTSKYEEVKHKLLLLYDKRKELQEQLNQLNQDIYITEEMLMYAANRES